MASGDPGLIAIGEDDGDGSSTSTALMSAGGLTWERVHTMAGALVAITCTDGRYTAVGMDPATGEALVLVSDDGRTWIPAEGPAGVFTDARMSEVTGIDAVVVVVGKIGLRDGAIWTYTDG